VKKVSRLIVFAQKLHDLRKAGGEGREVSLRAPHFEFSDKAELYPLLRAGLRVRRKTRRFGKVAEISSTYISLAADQWLMVFLHSFGGRRTQNSH
jgi:hypothetical protein